MDRSPTMLHRLLTGLVLSGHLRPTRPTMCRCRSLVQPARLAGMRLIISIWSAQGAQPPTAPPATAATDNSANPVSAWFNKFNDNVLNNPALLLGMAAGFAGAPSFGTGMQRAFQCRAYRSADQTVAGLDAASRCNCPNDLAHLRPVIPKRLVASPAVRSETAPIYPNRRGRLRQREILGLSIRSLKKCTA